jgi:citrate synthase
MADEEYTPGLEGVVAGETRLSRIDGEEGELVIAGFPIADLARNAGYEETLFLLYEDRLPTPEELETFSAALADRREVAPEVHDVLRRAAAEDADAMEALRMGAATASPGAAVEGGGDESVAELDARRVVAAFPTIVAAYWRYRQGEEAVDPREDLRHAANYLYMLTGEEPDEAAVRGLETYLNTVVDHGLNASTFTARTIVSTESDVVSAVTGAVGALKGPLHGGAPGPVLEMLRSIHESGDTGAWLRERLDAGERLMGFGHRVYRVRDPRAAVLSEAARQFYEGADEDAFFETVRTVEDVAVDLLEQEYPDRRLETNVEFYTAALLHGVGIPRELFAATFGVARVGGWTAHCLEQLSENRLVRPRSRYVGAEGRSWTPPDER